MLQCDFSVSSHNLCFIVLFKLQLSIRFTLIVEVLLEVLMKIYNCFFIHKQLGK